MATIEHSTEVEVPVAEITDQLPDERVACRNADGRQNAGVVVRRED